MEYLKKRWFLYEVIDKNLGLSIDGVEQKIKWKSRKISHYVNKLVKDKVVLQLKYFPTPFRDSINWDEMKYTKKLIN